MPHLMVRVVRAFLDPVQKNAVYLLCHLEDDKNFKKFEARITDDTGRWLDELVFDTALKKYDAFCRKQVEAYGHSTPDEFVPEHLHQYVIKRHLAWCLPVSSERPATKDLRFYLNPNLSWPDYDSPSIRFGIKSKRPRDTARFANANDLGFWRERLTSAPLDESVLLGIVFVVDDDALWDAYIPRHIKESISLSAPIRGLLEEKITTQFMKQFQELLALQSDNLNDAEAAYPSVRRFLHPI